MNDINLTLYKVGNADQPYLQYLSLNFITFAIIPLSIEARKHVMGVMNFAQCDLVLLKGKAMEEVLNFLIKNNYARVDEHELDEEQMLWYISQLETPNDKIYVTAPEVYQHPCKLKDKELTFQQCVSYWRITLRNFRDKNNLVVDGWMRDTLMIRVNYWCEESKKFHGGITLGIEPDGYTHS